MHVAIDARELCGRPTGVGRYLAGLLDAWAASDASTRHRWTLFAHATINESSRWPVEVRILPGEGGTGWEQSTLPRAVRAVRPDVFFAPGYTAPLTMPAPLVLTVHDVSYFAHPEWFSFREGVRRRWLTAWSARRARAVITDTEFSRSEIRSFIGIDDTRIRAIPLGISHHHLNDPADARKHERLSDPVVLYVGSVFERRRVDRLIECFDAVVALVPSARLEIVGENRTRRPRIDLDALRRRTANADRIHIRSYVDDATLTELYRSASVFAFLSEYEGFGFTPLEALAEGVPPILLDTAVARETCGEAAHYVPATASNTQLAAAIANLMINDKARHDILRYADGVLARYDWADTAAATLAVLEESAVGR